MSPKHQVSTRVLVDLRVEKDVTMKKEPKSGTAVNEDVLSSLLYTV